MKATVSAPVAASALARTTSARTVCRIAWAEIPGFVNCVLGGIFNRSDTDSCRSRASIRLEHLAAFVGICALMGIANPVRAQCTTSQLSPNPNPSGSTITISDFGCNGLNAFQNSGSIQNSATLINFSGATLTNIGSAEIRNKDGGTLNNSRGAVLDNRAYIANSTLTSITSGTLNNAGLLMNNGGWLDNWRGGTLNNGNEINNSNRAVINNFRGATLNNNYGALITIGDGAGLVNSGGTLNNNFGATISTFYSSQWGGGRLVNSDGGTLNNNVGGTLQNDGLFGTISNDRFSILNNMGTLTNNNPGGSSTLTNAGMLNNTGMLDNRGSFRNGVDGSPALFRNDGLVAGTGTFLQTSGTTINNGSLTQSAITISGGVLKGTGTITGTLTLNGGTLQPGNSPGVLTVTGDYTQTTPGHFDAEIGGLTAGTQYDVLNVSGTAKLGGTLNVVLYDLGSGVFSPHAGDSFDIITAQDILGTFSTLSLANLAPNLMWHVSYLHDFFGTTDVVRLSVNEVAAVPEPETYAMLLAGLSLLGFAARRRKLTEVAGA